jgi:hypothetical protein
MCGLLLGDIELATILQIRGHAGGTKRNGIRISVRMPAWLSVQPATINILPGMLPDPPLLGRDQNSIPLVQAWGG